MDWIPFGNQKSFQDIQIDAPGACPSKLVNKRRDTSDGKANRTWNWVSVHTILYSERYLDWIMKEYEHTVSEEDAYEAQYKTGCETPVRTNSGERKPTNLVPFFFFFLVYCFPSWLFKDLVPSFFFKTGHQLPPVWGTLWITSCKQAVSSTHKRFNIFKQMGGCD
jgi:hypothetical protein